MLRKKKKFFKLRISVTDICNLSCKHCFAKAHAKHMDYGLFKKAVDDLFDMHGEDSIISYMGGEPMLYPHAVESVYYITGKNMKVSFTTNGYRVDMEKLKKIKQAGEVVLAVSLDGPEEFHNFNRGKADSYSEAVKTIEAVSGMQDVVVISLPIFKESTDFFDFYRSLLKQYKCMLRFSRFVPVGRGQGILDQMASRNDYDAFFRFAGECNTEAGRLCVDIMDPFFPNPINGNRIRSCTCGKKIAFINTDGEVWPCWRMQLTLGDLKSQHLRDILANPIIDDYMDESMLKGSCAVCQNKNVCKGGCHAVPYTLFGDYHGEDPQCPSFKRMV